MNRRRFLAIAAGAVGALAFQFRVPGAARTMGIDVAHGPDATTAFLVNVNTGFVSAFRGDVNQFMDALADNLTVVPAQKIRLTEPQDPTRFDVASSQGP